MSAANELTKPILPGTAASDYERYLRTDELLALQKTEDERRHPDELTFQVVHQASELLMKGAVHEVDRGRERLMHGDFFDCARLLRRALMMLDPPIQLLRVLETITPFDYQIIRQGLGHGSGLDSPGFSALLHIAPRLGDAFYQQLEAHGLSVIDLYRRHAEFFGLHEVAECMLDFDERVQAFRFHHLKLAQRIIGGFVAGTMGTPVEVLRQRQEHLFYKPLWDVRNEITRECSEARTGDPDAPQLGHGKQY
ncbi:MAG TPA: tryptophan 2,3-dioxygenase family protein [Terriglobales bacterium]|nr:tryptophan 2,3-dioxygenase family protein [Terriglobales bacterium]